MKSLRILACALLLPAVLSAQAPARQDPALTPQRRAQLEAQIFNRFLTRVSTDMKLDAAGKARLETHLRQMGEQRRALAQQSVQLRRRLMNAVRDSAMADADIQRLLNDLADLKRREEQLWQRDMDTLDRLLTPRQRGIYILQWMQFNDRLRELLAQQRPRRD